MKMNNREVAELIIKKLNKAGAELGTASIHIVMDVLDNQFPPEPTKAPGCTCNAYILENFGCKCGADKKSH